MERWKKIKGFEGYEISDFGRVRSLDRVIKTKKGTRTIRGKILKLNYNKNGYVYIDLCIGNIHKMKRIHRLVAESFIENPENKDQINHKNGIKTDNRASNLEWATSSENNIHAFETGLNSNEQKRKPIYCSNGMQFISSYDAAEWINMELFKGKKLTKNIASKIRSCCNGFQKVAYGFIWRNKLDKVRRSAN